MIVGAHKQQQKHAGNGAPLQLPRLVLSNFFLQTCLVKFLKSHFCIFLLHNISQLTFENFSDFFFTRSQQKFSIASSLLKVLWKITIQLTFENFDRFDVVRRKSAHSVHVAKLDVQACWCV